MTKELQEYKRAYFAQTGRLASQAMEAKAKSGIYPLRLPIGYKRVFQNGKEHIEIDPTTAPLIRLAFELIARRRSSLSKVLATIRIKGLSGHSGQPISWGALHRILRCEFYTGVVRYRGKTGQGCQEPIVGRSLFERAQSSLMSRQKR
jgi:hypothetical protein